LAALIASAILVAIPNGLLAGAPSKTPAHPETISNDQALAETSAPTLSAPPAAKKPVDAMPLADFKINYSARYSAFKLDASLQLKKMTATDTYSYEVTTKARGLAKLLQSGTARERSEFVLSEQGLQSVLYTYDDGSGKEENGSRIARSVHETVSAELLLETEIHDRLTADLNSIIQLRNGQAPKQQVIVYRNSIRRYNMTALGEETIDIPAGTFVTEKFLRQRTNSKRSTLIWFAKDANYLPVRIEQQKNGKTNVTMVAKDISTSD
jgi:hypothetical protein